MRESIGKEWVDKAQERGRPKTVRSSESGYVLWFEDASEVVKFMRYWAHTETT